eukprot:COSAG02_NODE_71063_length_192_cov_101.827957_1_plen_35_part_10
MSSSLPDRITAKRWRGDQSTPDRVQQTQRAGCRNV